MNIFDERKQRMARLFQICCCLDARRKGERITISTLAQLCNSSSRTIQRDLTFLREADVDFGWDAKAKSFVLKSPLPYRQLKLTMSEILALCLAQQSLAHPDQPFARQAQTAFDAITGLLPAPLREELQSARQTVSIGANTRRDYSNVPLLPLQNAIKARHSVKMRYYTQSRQTESTRRVDPYHVMQRKGYWNLVAWCHTRQEVLLFSLDMIRGIEPTEQRFEIHPDYKLETYMQGSVGMLRGQLTPIRVRFESRMASWVRRHQWGFQATLTQNDDGSLLMAAEVSGIDEICKELLRWGACAEVLEPLELRQALHKEALAIAAKNALPRNMPKAPSELSLESSLESSPVAPLKKDLDRKIQYDSKMAIKGS